MKRSLWDHAKRVILWIVSGITILSGYGLAKLEPFAEARLLPLTPIDTAIPLVPWTIWIYGSGTVVCLIAWLAVPDGRSARRFYFTLLMSALLCWVFFFLVPTTFPRELWPLPPGDSPTLREFADLRNTDSPSNCFPSQHVALAWGLALCWSDWTKRTWVRVGIVAWAAAVSVCTLTTKQHYLVDVPGGFLAAALSWWAVRHSLRERAPAAGLALHEDRERAVISGLLAKVRAQTWSLETIPWPTQRPSLPREMVELLSHTIWIEEIAGLNFRLLEQASADSDLRAIYGHFADEERRHAEGLRRLLGVHGHEPLPPGLGAALILDQFDTLSASDPLDVALVLTATPVFETFLDAGTIPFLRAHPCLEGPWVTELLTRFDRDEGAHLAVNWLMTRKMAREHGGFRGLRLLANPNIPRGMVAVAPLALETYGRACMLGFDLAVLQVPFDRLAQLHRKAPELGSYALWWLFRLFVLSARIWVWVVEAMARHRVLFLGFWMTWARGTDQLGRLLFGAGLMERRFGPR